MVNRKVLFIFLLVFIVVLIGGILLVISKNRTPEIKLFDVSEYQYYIDKFSSENSLGAISNSKDLLKKVEAFWIKEYGEFIKNQKPYQVFYDEVNSVWLVHGTLLSDIDGGVASILVDNDTGKVLAVWHDK